MEGISLLEFGGEVGRVLPLQVKECPQPRRLPLLLNNGLVQLFQALNVPGSTLAAGTLRAAGCPIRPPLLSGGLQLEFHRSELESQLLRSGLSGSRRGGRLRPSSAPPWREPAPELLQLLPQVCLAQLGGRSLLLMAARSFPGVLKGPQSLLGGFQGIGQQLLVFPLKPRCLALRPRERRA